MRLFLVLHCHNREKSISIACFHRDDDTLGNHNVSTWECLECFATEEASAPEDDYCVEVTLSGACPARSGGSDCTGQQEAFCNYGQPRA